MSDDLAIPAASSSSGIERLRKRCRVISSSSATSDTSISPELQRETYTRYRYRVGSPALKRLPLMTLDETEEEILRFEQTEPSIRHILNRFGIRSSTIEIVRRYIPEEDGLPLGDRTVLIEAGWTGDDCFQSWIGAVDRIRGLLRNHPSTRYTKVEIIAIKLTLPRGMEAVEPGHPILAAWPRLLLVIKYILFRNSSLAKHWLSIDLIRLGPKSEYSPPLPVVVSVLVDWACDPSDWDNSRSDIDELLAWEGFSEAHAEFEHGDVFTAASPAIASELEYVPGGFIHTTYQKQLNMGADLGPIRDPSVQELEPDTNQKPPVGLYGTLGGYLSIQKENEQARIVGLTNYHAIRPAIPGFRLELDPSLDQHVEQVPQKGELLSKLDKNGFGPKHEVRKDTSLQSPSTRKHTATMIALRQLLDFVTKRSKESVDENAKARKSLYETKIRELEEFMRNGNHNLGNVLMASGSARRSSGNHRLDWALIDVNQDRIGRNIIPEESEWPGSSGLSMDPYPQASVCGKPLQGKASLEELVRRAEQGDLIGEDPPVSTSIYKVGARTKLTHGNFTFMKHLVRLSPHDGRLGMGESTEFCFVQKIKTGRTDIGTTETYFALNGDSGALCFDHLGKWTGQVWGGATRQGVKGKVLTYVTPQEDILTSVHELLNKVDKGWKVDLATD